MAGLLLSGLALLAAHLPSCALDADAGATPDPLIIHEAYACEDDTDCMAGLVCDLLAQVCVAADAAPREVSLRLVPPSDGSDMLEEQFPGIMVGDSGPLRLVIPRPLRILGTVAEASGQAATAVTIVAVAAGDLPGLDYYGTSGPAPLNEFTQTYLGGDGFELFVKPDRTYDVYLHRAPESGLPPFHIRRAFHVGEDALHPHTSKWEIVLPEPGDFFRIRGVVVESLSSPTPVVGARIFLRAPETGELSTTAETDGEGRFEVLVQPPDGAAGGLLALPEYEAHVRASEVNPTVPQVVAASGLVLSGETDLGVLEVGFLGTPVPVTLAVQDGSGLFLPDRLGGTTVRLTGAVGRGTVEVEALVDAEGRAAFQLPTGAYVVSVLPPPEGDLALLQAPLAVEAGRPEVTTALHLEPRPELSGWVVTPDGTPLEGVLVTAVFTGKGAYPTTSPLPERRFLATSGADGAYSLRLDPGQYRVIADPPASAGLPRRIEPYVFVTSSEQRTLHLDSPMAVIGLVEAYPPIDEQGRVTGRGLQDRGTDREPSAAIPLPATNVKVEVFPYSPEWDPGTTRIPLAETWTLEDGQFLLLLPASD